MSEEVYISVDIEAAGPIPGEYSMLSLGACAVADPQISFYAELKPINENAVAEAIKVSGFDLQALASEGQEPMVTMEKFRAWVKQVAAGSKPVFVGFNAGFDWSFVNWYFHKYLGENPFGFGALDIKAYYMGAFACNWSETSSSQLPPEIQSSQPQTHNALDDARAQADIFRNLLKLSQARGSR